MKKEPKTKNIEFLESGDSPEIGVFEKGEKRPIAESIAEIFIKRKMAKEIRTRTTQEEVER